ncbi:MAG: hypothetical protein IJT01_11215 [Selenomonadaceae bacterium]|nr:hypothetical protein [Selenomonadaceae bacterium]
MKKWIGAAFLLFALHAPFASAAEIPDRPTVAVMDFGKHAGATTKDIIMTNTDKTASDYIIEALVNSNHYDVMSKELLEEKIAAEGLNTTGLVDPDTAKRIGELLGVRYIIYGNLNDLSGSGTGCKIIVGGANVHTVKAHIIARMMDVETGDIVMAAKGEGSSKSAEGMAGTEKLGYITIGSKRISQVSVHNSLKKAAYDMVDKLTERLFGKKAK